MAIRSDHLAPPSADVERWIKLHATPDDGWLAFECACLELTPAGTCRIYDDRPDVCRDYQPGSPDCFWSILRRRTAEDYGRICEAQDPTWEQLIATSRS